MMWLSFKGALKFLFLCTINDDNQPDAMQAEIMITAHVMD